MAATVLGKRRACIIDAAAGEDTIVTRSKRRIVLNEPNDENHNPFALENGDHGMDMEQNELPVKTPSHKRKAKAAPASSRIDKHFKVGKPSIEIYEDVKDAPALVPQTPRHRDALSKKVPVTPKHRVLHAATPYTPKTPRTPITPSTSSVYNQARQLFSRCTHPGKLVGRESERQELSEFVQQRLASTSSGCLYISGPPGTGKSALVDEVCQAYQGTPNISILSINCMSIRNAKDLGQKLIDEFHFSSNTGINQLRECFLKNTQPAEKSFIVILDEVDRLVDLDLNLLHNLFEWSLHPASRLVLIGIANALDLTDRVLPQLKSRNLKPDLLPFLPYNATQIAEVLTSKLKTLVPSTSNAVPFLHPAAIQFCAKKVASQTGDLRKAFDICRRAIDLVDQESRERDAAQLSTSPSAQKTPLMENMNLSSPPSTLSPMKKAEARTAYTPETAPKVTIAHMAKITSLVFGNGTAQRLRALNLQQKAVLCSLSALEHKNNNTTTPFNVFATPSKRTEAATAAPTVKQVYESYARTCTTSNLLAPLSAVEFRDVISSLESLGLLSFLPGHSTSRAGYITPLGTPSRKGRGGRNGGSGFAAPGTGGIGMEDKRVASALGKKELLSAVMEGGSSGAGADVLRAILEEAGEGR